MLSVAIACHAVSARRRVHALAPILFGASGSGKTTVLRAVAGLTRPDSGRISVGDRTLFDARSRVDLPVEQRRIGYVFQQLALFPHM
jgi:molybdate transport system ATP-binding protein